MALDSLALPLKLQMLIFKDETYKSNSVQHDLLIEKLTIILLLVEEVKDVSYNVD